MKVGKRLLLLAASAALALGALTACGGDSSAPNSETTGATATTQAPDTTAPEPLSGTYVAEIPGPAWMDNSDMYLAINVEGENVAAFGSNDKNESAWFFGTQKDGSMELTSEWLDKLTATVDGPNLNGTLVLNLPEAEPLKFTATPATGPAGMYTATEGDARASWVVMGNGRAYGVMNPYSQRDRRALRQITMGHSPLTQGYETQGKVRQHRLNTQYQQAPQLAFGEWTTDLNGQTVKAVEVTGDMKSLPASN